MLQSASEHEFILARLSILQEKQNTNNSGNDPWPAIIDKREERLLRKLLISTKEGQVRKTLKNWRQEFGEFYNNHKQKYSPTQKKVDAWFALPPSQRPYKPQEPPPPLYKDKSGQKWLIDDRFLKQVDELIRRLDLWLSP